MISQTRYKNKEQLFRILKRYNRAVDEMNSVVGFPLYFAEISSFEKKIKIESIFSVTSFDYPVFNLRRVAGKYFQLGE